MLSVDVRLRPAAPSADETMRQLADEWVREEAHPAAAAG
jgi:hypothetical protein